MIMETRLRVLEKIYSLHADFCSSFDLACDRGCAVCCTANVTLTTLEALNIIRHWHGQGRSAPVDLLKAATRLHRFQPTLTINRMAALCLQGKPVPEEAADPGAGSCPLLADDQCSIYAVRPLACRAMVSCAPCVRGGAAEMPDAILAANHLLMQFVEALDFRGASGNLVDVLLFLLSSSRVLVYTSTMSIEAKPPLISHHAIPALMIPPELRGRLLPLAQTIQNYIQKAEA